MHVAATASSGLAVKFSASTAGDLSSATGPNNANISPKAVGVCTVQADQSGEHGVRRRPAGAAEFNITKGQQTITFAAIPDRALKRGWYSP